MNVEKKIIEKQTLTTGAGSKIEYDSYAECNGEKKRCCKKIPAGKFRHDGEDHRCYSGDPKDHLHSCTVKCDSWCVIYLFHFVIT